MAEQGSNYKIFTEIMKIKDHVHFIVLSFTAMDCVPTNVNFYFTVAGKAKAPLVNISQCLQSIKLLADQKDEGKIIKKQAKINFRKRSILS